MAVGDGVAVYIGNGGQSRQPSAGVEEKITSVVKSSVNTQLWVTDGSDTIIILAGNVNVSQTNPASTSTSRLNMYHTAYMLTNSNYIQAQNTTDRIYLGGVQTNV